MTKFSRALRHPGVIRPASMVLSVGLLAAVAGCADFNVRRELGVIGAGPDPFTVVRNKELQMPTDTSALPEPKPGAPSLVEPTPEADARAALGGTGGVSSTAPSTAEEALIRGAGAADASDEIRTALEEDTNKEDERLLDGVIDTLVGGSGPNVDPLDPAEEARRLAEEARKEKNPDLVVPAAEE